MIGYIVVVAFSVCMASTNAISTTPSPETTTTTTIKPTPTSTAPVPPTSVNPTPAPVPKSEFYVKEEATDYICLVMRLNGSIAVPYNTTNNQTRTANVPVLNSTIANVNGSCSQGWSGKPGESIQFNWQPLTTSPVWNLSIYLQQTSDNKSYFVAQVQVQYSRSADLFVNATELGKVCTVQAEENYNHTVHRFETGVGKYYECLSAENVNMQDQVVLKLDFLTISAFRNQTTKPDLVGERLRCTQDTLIHNLVPIIVGVCLALLIVIVLVAYLIGRRRAHAGYQSI